MRFRFMFVCLVILSGCGQSRGEPASHSDRLPVPLKRLVDAEILSATTISGTMVIGLTPIFFFWKLPAPKLSFYLSVFCGIGFGLLLVFNLIPECWILTQGRYADLLWANIWAAGCCLILYMIPAWIKLW